MIEINNRKANYDYEIIDKYECGIVLVGTEVKSIRNGNANLKDSYAIIRNNELFLLNMHIGEYKEGNIFNHDERRTRKLLMHKKDILKFRDKLNIEGFTLIPLKLYFVKNKVKIKLGLCKGKKNYDKREAIKKKTMELEVKKSIKDRY